MGKLSGRSDSVRKIALLEPAASTTSTYSGMRIAGQGAVLIGTILAQHGYAVNVYIEKLSPFDWSDIMSADLVGVSSITPTAPRSYAIADAIKRANIPVVIGGFHATFLPDEALDHADFVVRGEGEDTILELVQAIETDGDFSQIRGLSFHAGGKKMHNGDRPLESNLDRFPVPNFSFVKGMQREGVISIMTRRGCPFDCSFCSVAPFSGKAVREHSVERVLYEIERQMHWIGKHGALFFSDDTFNLRPERMKQILRGMIENRLTPLWVAQVRHEAAHDRELLDLMRESNCARLLVGFESINPRALERWKKRESLEDIVGAIRALQEARIKIHGMFVLGSDEDTLDTIEETLRFARAHDLDSMQINCLTPLPGSRDFRDIASRPGVLLPAPWTFYDGNHVVHVPKRIDPALLQVSVTGAMRRFYSIKGIAERVLKGDLSEAAVRIHGYRLIRRFARESRPYVRWLKDPHGPPPAPPGRVFLKPDDLAAHALRGCHRVSLLKRFRLWMAAHCRISLTRFAHLPSAIRTKAARQQKGTGIIS